eukprot:SAG11_NODE_326_length_10708_cov_6.937035_5_plen_58_part_00
MESPDESHRIAGPLVREDQQVTNPAFIVPTVMLDAHETNAQYFLTAEIWLELVGVYR